MASFHDLNDSVPSTASAARPTTASVTSDSSSSKKEQIILIVFIILISLFIFAFAIWGFKRYLAKKKASASSGGNEVKDLEKGSPRSEYFPSSVKTQRSMSSGSLSIETLLNDSEVSFRENSVTHGRSSLSPKTRSSVSPRESRSNIYQRGSFSQRNPSLSVSQRTRSIISQRPQKSSDLSQRNSRLSVLQNNPRASIVSHKNHRSKKANEEAPLPPRPDSLSDSDIEYDRKLELESKFESDSEYETEDEQEPSKQIKAAEPENTPMSKEVVHIDLLYKQFFGTYSSVKKPDSRYKIDTKPAPNLATLFEKEKRATKLLKKISIIQD